ncbi:uncharacterized protein LOC123891864 [Trifolium pratense]|uniref:uncharacterized protein LOC123891864 n=1 Tax=Trifolium pratense TaxID=57577 RepID=UPI001E695F64|nr:uncharacterized protein LOC123891864 [Trifolium pratense]
MKNIFKKSSKDKEVEVGSSKSRSKVVKKRRVVRTPTPSPSPSPPPSPPREQSPPPPTPVVIEIPRSRFVRPTAYNRYQTLKSKDFKPERRLTDEVLAFPLIEAEFRNRHWYEFNFCLRSGNRTLALEFLSNAWRVKNSSPRIAKVRGVDVDYSPETINRIFHFNVPEFCVLNHRRENRATMASDKREALKSQLTAPGSVWVRPSRQLPPQRFKTAHLLDIPRIWAEFWINNVEPSGNNSEIPMDIGLALQAILLGEDIDLGTILSDDLSAIIQKDPGSYSLTHLCLITKLCLDQNVAAFDDDQMEEPRKVTTAFVRDVRRKTFGKTFIPFADVDDVMDYTVEGGGEEREENVENVMHHEVPQAPEMEGFPAPQFDVNVLADMVWKMDMSTQQGIDMADHYDTSSALWQASMRYREQVPAYFYPRYPTMHEFDEAHNQRVRSMAATHERNRATYIRQRRAAGLPDEGGSSSMQFPGNLPRFDHDHNMPEQD